MGKHMATNLITAKHQVAIFDVNPQALDHFKDQSRLSFSSSLWIYSFVVEQAKFVSVPQQAVDKSDFVILMLPNGKIVRDVCQSNIFPYGRETYLFVVFIDLFDE